MKFENHLNFNYPRDNSKNNYTRTKPVNPVNKRSSIRIALPVSSIGIQYSGSSGTRHPATEPE